MNEIWVVEHKNVLDENWSPILSTTCFDFDLAKRNMMNIKKHSYYGVGAIYFRVAKYTRAEPEE